MCQTNPFASSTTVRFVSGDSGMTWLGRRSAMLSNRSSSTRVAPADWTAKLIPSGVTVGPSGSGSPGKRFVIFGMGPQGGLRRNFGKMGEIRTIAKQIPRPSPIRASMGDPTGESNADGGNEFRP